jgi:8-oxo-dGTP pyrophosphatase MutT (NUDIX family)
MKPAQIRPLVICIFSQDNTILAAEGYDPAKAEVFYRPVGGGIHFGEYSQDALVREIREEFEAEITNIRFLGALENIFTYDGQLGHEIVLVYDAKFANQSLYDQTWIVGYEDDGLSFKAVWKRLADFQRGSDRLYPDGLWELLCQHGYA